MSIFKFLKHVVTAGFMPLYLGGDSNADSSTTTITPTTNNVSNSDGRIVASDEAVALSGDGNTSNKTSTTSTDFTDNSNRSTNFADASNSSTNFADASNRSVTTVNTVTDYGSVGKALELSGAMTTGAYGLASTMTKQSLDYGGLIADDAFNSLNKSGANQLTALSSVLSFASAQSANALTSASDAMGFAAASIDKTKSAFESAAQGPENKTMLIVALAVVGAVGVASFMR